MGQSAKAKAQGIADELGLKGDALFEYLIENENLVLRRDGVSTKTIRALCELAGTTREGLARERDRRWLASR